MQDGTLLAAVDLGSNSFRLEIGRFEHGHIQRVEYLKETVRQGGGLDEERNLSLEAMQRGWDCLARFAERLAGFQRAHVRGVATQTLREAANRDVFLERAREILGFPIDVISGPEEARLIYQGVVHLLPQSDERRLVIDIGGRSTELILGQGYRSEQLASYRVGSVNWSMQFFASGRLSASAFHAAEVAARAVLDEALLRFKPGTWDMAYGSSGTVGAVSDVLSAAGWPAGEITAEGLDWLRDRLVQAGSVDKIRGVGIKEERRDVIGGGLSVLRALFSLFKLKSLSAAQGALRQGVLFDLIDREDANTDARSSTVERLARRFAVDEEQAARVTRTALTLYRQLIGPARGAEAERRLRKLGWAARLHEIGTAISHSSYHRHGSYILDHAEAPGFAEPELHHMSQLVLGHRGKLRKLDVDLRDPETVQPLLCLRLAVILCHARRAPDLRGMALAPKARGLGYVLHTRAGWAQAYPQSAHLLDEEAAQWRQAGAASFGVVEG